LNNINKIKKPKYELIAIDLDDTLIGPELLISRRNQTAIRHARDLGVKIVIATGRTFTTTLPFIEKLGIHTPAICYQGAEVRTKNNILFYKPLPLKYVKPILKIGIENKVQILSYIDDIVSLSRPLTQAGREYLGKIELVKRINIVDFEKYRFAKAPLKIMFIANRPKTLKMQKETDKIFSGKVYSTLSRSTYLEFLNYDVSKGKALEFVAKMYRIPMRKVMCIGDSYNDVPMFEEAGLSVAVRNAPSAVEKRADFVVASEKRDGVAQAIERFVLS